MEVDINNCARCGLDHDNLEFEELEHSCPSDDEAYTHWAGCPTNGQPVMLEIVETDSDEVELFRSSDDPDLDF